VLEQHIADDAAAQAANQAHRREPEQVHVLAAGDRAAQQSVGEDAEQVKGRDENVSLHAQSLLSVISSTLTVRKRASREYLRS
jgi:hypothetical protein